MPILHKMTHIKPFGVDVFNNFLKLLTKTAVSLDFACLNAKTS
jgi:hypothetical protein